MSNRSTYLSLTKGTCKTCGSRYIRNESWEINQCPVCFVTAMHGGYNYMPGTDAVFWSKTDDFFVVRIPQHNGEYKLSTYTPTQYDLYLKRIPNARRAVFSGTLQECLTYIKSQ